MSTVDATGKDARPDLGARIVEFVKEPAARSILVAGAVFVALFIAGSIAVEGFSSSLSIRSMLLFASFLGIASIGQTLCAIAGGLDLSIPFVIGASNVLTLWLISKGLGSVLAIVIMLAVAALFGALTGVICSAQREKALLVSLGMGFAVLGAAQIIVSLGSEHAGTVYAEVPKWLIDTTSLNSSSFGIDVSPAVLIWAAIAIVVIFLLRRTTTGRGLYAMAGNEVAASRVRVPVLRIWVLTYSLSAVFAAFAGVLLLGFGGGAFAEVGQPYLFTTVAAVVIGGTSLLGGRGGYGLTVLGVAVLTLLNTLLVGIGLSTPAQQAVLGLIIVPMVALYGREAHPKTQI
jgi:ribose transport system permease protein